MCVAFPMKVVALDGPEHGTVSCAGVERAVNFRLLPDCRVGDYVLVHAGYAIETVSPAQAESDLELFRELREGLAE